MIKLSSYDSEIFEPSGEVECCRLKLSTNREVKGDARVYSVGGPATKNKY
jgi:hypothetical protein